MKLSDMARQMLRATALCMLCIIAAGIPLSLLHIAAFAPIALGAVYGASDSVLNILLIDRTVKALVDRGPERAGSYVRTVLMLRFALTGILFAIAAIAPFINVYSAAAGILSFQVATLSMGRTSP